MTLDGELKARWTRVIGSDEMPGLDEAAFFSDRPGGFSTVMWVPHERQYVGMLRRLNPGDVVADVGAGDLRFALRAAARCRKVYAVEMNPRTLGGALDLIGYRLPRNLVAVCADWRDWTPPPEVSVVVAMVQVPDWIFPPASWRMEGRRFWLGTLHPGGVSRIRRA